MTNATAYVPGLSATTGDDKIHAAFQQYGIIHEVRIPGQYAFVRYSGHESATMAIFDYQDGHKTVAGRPVTVHWGKEGGGRRPMGRGIYQNHNGGGHMPGYNQSYNSNPPGHNYRAFGQRNGQH